MTAPSLETLVMLQPIGAGGLYDILRTQLEAALACQIEDTSHFTHVCRVLFDCIVDDTFATLLTGMRWDAALGRVIAISLDSFAHQRHDRFIAYVTITIGAHGPHDHKAVVDGIENELWQIAIEIGEYIDTFA